VRDRDQTRTTQTLKVLPSREARDPTDRLSIRWFTPRGRALRQELLADLRHRDGAHLESIVQEARRGGVPDGTLDLRGLDLAGEELAAIRLRGADLSGANLEGCDLSCSDLGGAKLRGARLHGAKLRGACLEGADLGEADLVQADLTEARLTGATFDGARLRGAGLRRAVLVGVDLTQLQGVDLSLAITTRVDATQATLARRERTGAPPMSEPRAPAERAAARVTGKIIPHETVRMARAAVAAAAAAAAQATSTAPPPVVPDDEAFDAALAELMRLRRTAQRIAVVVDGVEKVLYDPRRKRAAM
jgi:hypothetical protein